MSFRQEVTVLKLKGRVKKKKCGRGGVGTNLHFFHSSVCGTSQKYSRELICEMDTIIIITDFEKLIKQFSSLVQ